MSEESDQPSNVRQLRGANHQRIPERYRQFCEEFGAPEIAVLVMVREGDTVTHSFTAPDCRMSTVLGVIELAKHDLIKNWRADDAGD